ncbi:thioesterase family protein [Rhodanobacter sp. C01]|uniref:acyl-CoA thioesterase n=1 Tax=Rhodanobacter sp. C01 TaxID=1945856 RepID=UPI0009861AB7|nr:thioesterase family protein [Rhodanobacter sp. C01]OOG45827.1 thioesterase [Rhodanobacter sp. C01]
MSPRKSTTQAKLAEAPVANEATGTADATSKGGSDAALFVATLDVRWRDLDAFNHVNNANYLTYLEEARLQWLKGVREWFSETAMPVLAASTLNYRQSIAWPASLHIELRRERLGNSSITLAHRIVDADDTSRLYCDGHVVLVWMNPITGKPVSLPEAIRVAANEHKSD